MITNKELCRNTWLLFFAQESRMKNIAYNGE